MFLGLNLSTSAKSSRQPRVLNKRFHGEPEGSVYVGRPSQFGNPFIVGEDGSRKEVIRLYIQRLKERPELIRDIRRELRGKDLVCWCAPLPCHADVLLKIANR